jgi:transposase-like protein
MMENSPSCSRFGVSHQCPVCQSEQLIKSGKTVNGKQRYCCKNCEKRFITNYTYNACKPNTNQQIILLTKEGLGIRSIDGSFADLFLEINYVLINIMQKVISNIQTI